jgi:hypothetical protein
MTISLHFSGEECGESSSYQNGRASLALSRCCEEIRNFKELWVRNRWKDAGFIKAMVSIVKKCIKGRTGVIH